MRNYCYRQIEGSCEQKTFERTNKVLVANFNKVARWISENCPHLNGEFRCRHNPYYWIALVVEDGKAYLEEGSHGYDFSTAMSTTETAVFSRGSMQSKPIAYQGVQFFRNDRIEEFLRQWESIKAEAFAANKSQSYVYSDDFEA